MNKHLLNRRQFSARCAAFGLSFPTLPLMAARQLAQVTGTGAMPKAAVRDRKASRRRDRIAARSRAAGTSGREGIRRRSRKRRCAPAFLLA